MAQTRIEWADKTWSPITGCSKISEGCQNCYAERMSKRLAGRCGYDQDEPFEITIHQNKLLEPLKWKKPSRIFVCSMGDLFHEDAPFKTVEMVFNIMEEAEHHTFMVLTKRPERMLQFINWYLDRCSDESVGLKHEMPANIWLGVTAENQARADERIPILLQIPAEKRFVSIEPMLGSVDLTNLPGFMFPGCTTHNALLGRLIHHDDDMKWTEDNKVDWVICGGETGHNARPMHPDWARSLRNQCQDAGVSFFFKQWGEWAPAYMASDDDFGRVISNNKSLDSKPVMAKVGKKKAGRLLDGREWNEMPR